MSEPEYVFMFGTAEDAQRAEDIRTRVVQERLRRYAADLGPHEFLFITRKLDKR